MERPKGIFFLCSLFLLVLSETSYDLDETSYVYICRNCTVDLTISSSASSGYIWYLYSEDESKVLISDLDGEYISCSNGTSYQLFQAFCTTEASVGNVVDLTLILKKPWEQDPTIIKFVTAEVTTS